MISIVIRQLSDTRRVKSLRKPLGGVLSMKGYMSAIVASVSCSGFVAPTLHAQTCEYRIVDLGPLGTGFTYDPREDGSFGINDLGEVVYWDNLANQTQGRVWLPAANYQLPAGNHELELNSAARDISSGGLVVGQADGSEAGAGYAALWDLNDSDPGDPPDAVDIGPIISSWSSAFAISEGADPIVAGETGDIDNCNPCNANTAEGEVIRGFLVSILNGDIPDLLEPVANCNEEEPHHYRNVSRPRDIVGTSVFWRAAGYSSRNSLDGLGPIPPPGQPCDDLVSNCAAERRSTVWDTLNPHPFGAPLLDIAPPDDDRASIARGVNGAGNIVGWGFNDEPDVCDSRGLFWTDHNAIPDELSHSSNPNDETRAEAINSNADPTIVGINSTTNRAFRWKSIGGNWVDTALDQVAPNGCPLEFAHDINDNEWIICHGLPSTSATERHAYLLIPKDEYPSCDADMNLDGVVDVTDLLRLLGEWSSPCTADITGDCIVDTQDLLAMLGAWGDCGGPPQAVPQTVGDCLSRFPVGSLQLQKCLEAVSGQ